MAYPSVTYTFVNGTTASASEVNTNFSNLVSGLSDGTKDLSINALTAAGATNLNGTVNLGNATGDDVTVTGYIASALIPKTDDLYDLGTSTQAWQDGYFDGKVYTDALQELVLNANISCADRFLVDDTTDATSTTDGSLQTDGGLSVAKAAYIGTTLTVTGNATFNGTVALGNATTDDVTFTGYVASTIIPKTDDLYDLGTATQAWQDLYLDGNLYTDGISELTAAAGVTVNHALTVTGNATFNGTTTLGNATGDDITMTGYIASAMIPKTDDLYDLGTATQAWQDGYFDGKVYTDALQELVLNANVSCADRFLVDDTTDATSTTDGSLQTDGGLSVAKAAFIGTTLTVTGAATFNGTVALGNATADDVTFTGYVASTIIPKTDDTYDLGTAALAWQDIYLDGAAYTDTISELTSATGVTIDNLLIKDGYTKVAGSLNTTWSPSAAGSTDAYDSNGFGCVVVTSPNGATHTLNGVSSSGFTAGHVINFVVIGVGASSIVIANEAASAAASAKITTGTGGNITITTDGCFSIIFNGTRWWLLSYVS